MFVVIFNWSNKVNLLPWFHAFGKQNPPRLYKSSIELWSKNLKIVLFPNCFPNLTIYALIWLLCAQKWIFPENEHPFDTAMMFWSHAVDTRLVLVLPSFPRILYWIGRKKKRLVTTLDIGSKFMSDFIITIFQEQIRIVKRLWKNPPNN